MPRAKSVSSMDSGASRSVMSLGSAFSMTNSTMSGFSKMTGASGLAGGSRYLGAKNGDANMASNHDYEFSIAVVGDKRVGKTELLNKETEKRPFGHETPRDAPGIDLISKVYNLAGNYHKVVYWDVSGDEEFLEQTCRFVAGCNAVILVFDVCSKSSFQSLQRWITELDRSYELKSKANAKSRNSKPKELQRKLKSMYGADSRAEDNDENDEDESSADNEGGEDDDFAVMVSASNQTQDKPFRLLISNKMDEAEETREVANADVAQFVDLNGLDSYECSALTGENVNEAFATIVSAIVKTIPDEAEADASLAVQKGVKVARALKYDERVRYQQNVRARLPHKSVASETVDWL